jgi:Fe-S cluster assembly protein SufD
MERDAIFYLRSRGIGEMEARSLLTYAFANEVVQGIGVEPLRAQLERLLFQSMPEGRIAG